MNNEGFEIVKRIDFALEKKGLKRVSLARAIETRESTITSWSTRGSIPAADTAIRIAQFLGVSVEWLITGEDPDNLTPDERQLLDKYRIIDERDKESLLLIAQQLASRYLASETVEPEQSTGAVG